MKIIDLPVEPRDKLGSANSRRLRLAGHIPCILYGGKKEVVPLATTVDAFGLVLKERTALVRLQLDEKAQTALVRDLRWDTFGDYIQHVDFVRVEMTDEVRVNTPIRYLGTPKGAALGGKTQQAKSDLELLARVDSIPTEITIDISDMDIGDSIHVSDLPLPENCKPARATNEVLVQVVEPKLNIDPTEKDDEAEEPPPTE